MSRQNLRGNIGMILLLVAIFGCFISNHPTVRIVVIATCGLIGLVLAAPTLKKSHQDERNGQ